MDAWSQFVSSVSIIDLGSTGLLAVTVLMILTGRLVPKSAVDAWRGAYEKEREASGEKDKQIALLAQSASVTARVLDALPMAGGDPNESDPSHVRPRT